MKHLLLTLGFLLCAPAFAGENLSCDILAETSPGNGDYSRSIFSGPINLFTVYQIVNDQVSEVTGTPTVGAHFIMRTTGIADGTYFFNVGVVDEAQVLVTKDSVAEGNLPFIYNNPELHLVYSCR